MKHSQHAKYVDVQALTQHMFKCFNWAKKFKPIKMQSNFEFMFVGPGNHSFVDVWWISPVDLANCVYSVIATPAHGLFWRKIIANHFERKAK